MKHHNWYYRNFKNHKVNCKQLYINNLDNLDEMDKFLERHKTWFIKKTESLNRSITSEEVESLILKLPTKKSSGPNSFTGEF